MKIPVGFSRPVPWLKALTTRARIGAKPAVYALLHERAFGRLKGSSRILYIGYTGRLGGVSQSCRLRVYRYPNGHHAREIRRRVLLLLNRGVNVTIRWKHVTSRDAAKNQEGRLLRLYESSHHEFPPFNGRI